MGKINLRFSNSFNKNQNPQVLLRMKLEKKTAKKILSWQDFEENLHTIMHELKSYLDSPPDQAKIAPGHFDQLQSVFTMNDLNIDQSLEIINSSFVMLIDMHKQDPHMILIIDFDEISTFYIGDH
jgi:hypothetical protein